jgi:hypothetical protein
VTSYTGRNILQNASWPDTDAGHYIVAGRPPHSRFHRAITPTFLPPMSMYAGSSGIMGYNMKVTATGTEFPLARQSSSPTLIPPTAEHSPLYGGWYNRPCTDRRTGCTQSNTSPRMKTKRAGRCFRNTVPWLQTQRSRVRFPALPYFLHNSWSGTGSTQPREN